WPLMSNATWFEPQSSIADQAQAAWRPQARARGPAWTRTRIAASAAMGWAVASLVYASLQIAMAAHWIFADLAAGTIPLFFRWGVAFIAGGFAAAISCAADINQRVPWLAAWILGASTVATAIVVVFAP